MLEEIEYIVPPPLSGIENIQSANKSPQLEREIKMLNRINSIWKALNDENPHAALALALTLPDICGQIEYPGQKVGERYIAWFDKFVAPQYVVEDKEENKDPEKESKKQFDGKICYQLRCSYLHSGNTDVHKCVDDFKLACIKGNTAQFFNSFSTDGKTIKLDVKGLCYYICSAAKNYYESVTKEGIFDKYSTDIICSDDSAFSSLFHE